VREAPLLNKRLKLAAPGGQGTIPFVIDHLVRRSLGAIREAAVMTLKFLCLSASVALIPRPGNLSAQVGAFDPVRADKTDRVVCYHHRRYIVVQRRATEVGSDLFVRPAASGRCEPDSLPGDFVWRNKDAEYFLGLRGDVLFIDSGTGPDYRGLIVIDLRTRRHLLHTDYVGTPIAGPDSFTIGVWRGSELPKLAPGCPDTGMLPGIDSLFWIDLRSGVLRFAKRTRCAGRT